MKQAASWSQGAGRQLLRACSGESDEPGLWPNEVARMYGVPAGLGGAGQCVGIVALGGGYLPNDVLKAVRRMGVASPLIVDSPVSSVQNSFGSDLEADKELALDLQVLAGIIPAARIVVYFAPNSLQGLADAIAAAVADDVYRPGVVSISWGSAERFWPTDVWTSVEGTLARARERNITVAVASGDMLATAGLQDRTANVMYPGSSPQVLACGGSRMTLDQTGAELGEEVVWNDGTIGTGGGVSALFDLPSYQQGAGVPVSFGSGRSGRGVPDVAAAAAAQPGYRIVFDGQTMVKDGTSAATPLWAGLVALASAERGRSLGFINEYLYRNAHLCRDVTQGSNRLDGVGYDAMEGWDACTGLGTPWAEQLIESLMTVE